MSTLADMPVTWYAGAVAATVVAGAVAVALAVAAAVAAMGPVAGALAVVAVAVAVVVAVVVGVVGVGVIIMGVTDGLLVIMTRGGTGARTLPASAS